MKVTVKTTGQFLVHDVFGGQTVSPGEVKEVHVTEFITQALLDKRLEEVDSKGKGKEPAAPPAEKKAEDEKPAAGGPTSGAASKK
ncbi:hypothetical protein KNJ79_05340 [Sphingopyxis indica]|uniref:hypothetical protein n=1 Tax=Sphingopyxis indica TaxID=436663 RepID=UPI0029393B0A|nr:hypothetical protein [Sphingopyxis indica]WOF44357.1 hypothetical protein KNJ79_05340 [Sphingopyxis indica]